MADEERSVGSASRTARPRRRAITISDVALKAGVSIGTVSKALNGGGKLREQTRARVRDAADSLGFVPNSVAQGLASGRSFLVGMITNDTYGRYSTPVLVGAEDLLDGGRISVVLCDSRGDVDREEHYVRMLTGRNVDGFIVAGRNADFRPPIRDHHHTPVVYALTPSNDPADLSVSVDGVQGGRLAVEHLISGARTQIGHITGAAGSQAAVDRELGARRQLADYGWSFSGGSSMFGRWSELWGQEATTDLLLRAPQTDAIFAGSDQIARGVVDALTTSGRRVPDDVAVIGFDNWEIMATSRHPFLSSIDPNMVEVGRLAAQRLLDAIDGHGESGQQWVTPHVVTRESAPTRTDSRQQ